MAEYTPSASSSSPCGTDENLDSDFEEYVDKPRLLPYQFEPVRDESSSEENGESSDSDVEDLAGPAEALGRPKLISPLSLSFLRAY